MKSLTLNRIFFKVFSAIQGLDSVSARAICGKILDRKSDQKFSRELLEGKSATGILQVYLLKIPANITTSSRHYFKTSWRYLKHLRFRMKYVLYLTDALFQQHCWNIIFRCCRDTETPIFLLLQQLQWSLMESLTGKQSPQFKFWESGNYVIWTRIPISVW